MLMVIALVYNHFHWEPATEEPYCARHYNSLEEYVIIAMEKSQIGNYIGRGKYM